MASSSAHERAHFGMFFRMTGIQPVFDVAMEEVAPGQLLLQDGRRFPFRYAMIVPPFVGADVVKDSGIGNPRGFIDVKDT
jgi:sulfide:quinone oxidoreductase